MLPPLNKTHMYLLYIQFFLYTNQRPGYPDTDFYADDVIVYSGLLKKSVCECFFHVCYCCVLSGVVCLMRPHTVHLCLVGKILSITSIESFLTDLSTWIPQTQRSAVSSLSSHHIFSSRSLETVFTFTSDYR